MLFRGKASGFLMAQDYKVPVNGISTVVAINSVITDQVRTVDNHRMSEEENDESC